MEAHCNIRKGDTIQWRGVNKEDMTGKVVYMEVIAKLDNGKMVNVPFDSIADVQEKIIMMID